MLFGVRGRQENYDLQSTELFISLIARLKMAAHCPVYQLKPHENKKITQKNFNKEEQFLLVPKRFLTVLQSVI